jgi:putative acetyltransferase
LKSDPLEKKARDDTVIEVADPLSDAIAALTSALDRELNERCGAERNHGSPVTRLAQADVTVFVARRLGEAVGCVALQVEQDGSAEIKRMYVAPASRGLGVGRRLLVMVELEARRAKVRILRLETSDPLHEAMALYRRCDFAPCRAFGPYVAEPINLYFEKALE